MGVHYPHEIHVVTLETCVRLFSLPDVALSNTVLEIMTQRATGSSKAGVNTKDYHGFGQFVMPGFRISRSTSNLN